MSKVSFTARSAIVSGYATVDYAMALREPLMGPTTATVVALSGDHWPRPGGAPLYVARRLVAAGHVARLGVALGEDANGDVYLAACRYAGIDIATISRSARIRTPWCMLLYHDDGQYTCLIDRGDVDNAQLGTMSAEAAESTDLLCIAAGSPRTSAALLASVSERTCVAWIAKRDPLSFPVGLMIQLAGRSDVIFCNASERGMVDEVRQSGIRSGQAIIETRGAEGVLVEQGSVKFRLPCMPLQIHDATGAGDTLAGEVLANLLSGRSLEFAAGRGIVAARELLVARSLRPAI
ncbi:MAG: PfkB family carbohydrate kinase [Steroidobacteraceae bacterium]